MSKTGANKSRARLACLLALLIAAAPSYASTHIKFLLILILFSPAQERYRDVISFFETQEECEKVLEQVRARIAPRPGVSFALVCATAKPTDSTEA